jgi:hypothetical protein
LTAGAASGPWVRPANIAPATPIPTSTIDAAAVIHSGRLGGAAAAMTGSGGAGDSSAILASPMSRRRVLGSRSRQRAIRRRSGAGTERGSASKSMDRVSTAASVSETVSPSNSLRPASISNSTTPNAQMSARLSTGFPRACSGLM